MFDELPTGLKNFRTQVGIGAGAIDGDPPG
jgi:hypothetical protein